MSSQKFFDIIPPEKGRGSLDVKSRDDETLLRKSIKSERHQEEVQAVQFPAKKIFFLVIFILFLGGFLLHFFFQKAEITVWPETEVVSFTTTLRVSSDVEQPDFLNKIIPGEILISEKVISQEFSSSGLFLKETQSEGIIRVYNAYSTYPQVLIANTRFVSAEGRLFRSLERVTVPGGKYEGGKLQSGFLDIRVRAAEAGPEYNIKPSTFSIPGFAGTARYTAFYGKSFEPMKGGFREEVPQITQKDLDDALENFKERVKKEAEDVFKNKISEDLVLLNEAFRREEQSPFFSAKAGEEGDSFIGEIKILFKALVFKQSDLEKILKDFIASETKKDKVLKADSLQMSYMPEIIYLEQGQMTLDLDFSAKIYSKIDTGLLKKEITGKPLTETGIILDEKSGIIRSEVRLFPFWQSIIPKDFQKIKIELNIDGSPGSFD